MAQNCRQSWLHTTLVPSQDIFNPQSSFLSCCYWRINSHSLLISSQPPSMVPIPSHTYSKLLNHENLFCFTWILDFRNSSLPFIQNYIWGKLMVCLDTFSGNKRQFSFWKIWGFSYLLGTELPKTDFLASQLILQRWAYFPQF